MHFEVTKTTKKIYVGCLPTPALCQHHVFHVDSLLQSNVCEADGYTGLCRREGQCCSTLLTVSLGPFPSYFLARLGLKLR